MRDTIVCESKATRPSDPHTPSDPRSPISMLIPTDIECAERAKKGLKMRCHGSDKIPTLNLGGGEAFIPYVSRGPKWLYSRKHWTQLASLRCMMVAARGLGWLASWRLDNWFVGTLAGWTRGWLTAWEGAGFHHRDGEEKNACDDACSLRRWG